MHTNVSNKYINIRNIRSTFLSIPTAFLLLVIFRTHVSAQIVINEFNSWGTSGDWIELYAFEEVDISGWIIRDSASSVVSTIPQGTLLGPSSTQFYVIDVGNRLNKDGDVIKLLKNDDSSLVDQLSYGENGGVCAPNESQSAGRYPDANSVVERFKMSSKNLSNNNSEIEPCPTPTLEPTEKPTATPKPTNTPTQKPENTKIPTSTPKPKASQKPSPALSAEGEGDTKNERDQIEGEIAQNSQVLSEKDINENQDGARNKFPLFALILVLTGSALMGGSLIYYLKKRKKRL